MIWPADGYDLPVFWCNLTQMPFMHLNVPILDCIPMLDIVVWPEYATRYVQPLNALRDKALATLKDCLVDKAFALPSLVSYALSPFNLLPSIKDEGLDLVPQIVDDYVTLYVSFLQDAAPIADAEQRAFCKRKKDAARKLMKGNDPGYPFMLKIFGLETTHKVFDIVF
ncbi:MAG: hypothetical protein NTX06_01155 [Proteobacteria bacterium]|nr:hypothetical protein [Pseudomonadota bacterium]